MARTRLIDVPLVLGQHEGIDPKLLPHGALERVKNMRLRKDGRFGVRYGDTAVALTTNLNTTLVPNDLLSFDGRLFALGDSQSSTASLPSSDLCE